MYAKNNINNTSYEPDASEGNFLLLKIGNEATVVCTYRPPSFHNPKIYIDSLYDILKEITTNTVILTGDINLDIMPNKINGQCSDYLNMLASLGYKQCIDKPTRKNSCLDHFMVKGFEHNTVKTVVFEEFTDHSPILLYVNKTQILKTTIEYERIKMNYEKITKELNEICWDNYFLTTDTNEAANYLVNVIHNAINTNSKTIKIPKRNRPLKPWITPSVIKSLRKRDKLYKQLKKTPNDEEGIKYYKNYRNICKNTTKYLKNKYYEEQLKRNTKNSKELWTIIKEVCDMQQSKNTTLELLNIEKTTQTSSVDHIFSI